jgi:large subunit ribosomal protein L3
MNGLIGKKIGMTQIFDEEGRQIPVTVLEAGPCVVTQIKAADGNDRYDAVQLGFGKRKPKNTTMPMQGHFRKAGVSPVQALHEFRTDGTELNLGDTVDVSLFEGVDKVDVTGTSKGKGFQGRIKRWNQHRGPDGHGSRQVRASGSIGMATHPGRVLKGTHMSGQYGNKTHTKKNLTIVRVDSERNLLLVKGSVPGSKNGIVYIRTSR